MVIATKTLLLTRVTVAQLHKKQEKPGYDLIDNFNQRSIYGSLYPQDRVSGYTIKQIENSLRNTNSWGEWKEHIKQQNPSNPTNIYIDELFNNW